jgi:hypothetical protein
MMGRQRKTHPAAFEAVSMDVKGRYLDNVWVERPWRTVEYEDVYLRGYETVPGLILGLGGPSPSTTRSGRTSRWATRHRPRSTKEVGT